MNNGNMLYKQNTIFDVNNKLKQYVKTCRQSLHNWIQAAKVQQQKFGRLYQMHSVPTTPHYHSFLYYKDVLMEM